MADPRKQRTKSLFNSDESFNEKNRGRKRLSLGLRFGYHLRRLSFEAFQTPSVSPPTPSHSAFLSWVLVSFISARRNVEDNAEQHRLTGYDSILPGYSFPTWLP